MDKFLLKLLQSLHILLILFVLIAPFCNSKFILLLHVIIVWSILFHWINEQYICSLTKLEITIKTKMNKKLKYDDCFTCQFFTPIYKRYNLRKYHRTIITYITLFMVSISSYKYYQKFESKKINNIATLLEQIYGFKKIFNIKKYIK